MNRIYRHVWNKAQGRYVVAAETASSGRGSSRPAVSAGAVFGALLTVLCVNHAYAQTVVAPGGAATVYRSANGVQIINIEAANQAGLSHNRYTNYNVEQTGTVLNNGNASQLSRNSQLAGQVMNNPNLSAEARVILNEVVAPNRSSLRGFTEVLGSRADVVLANPWGITCAGCGFINTDRAVLSTGTPQFGPNGNLTEFRTIGGDILIEGAGLDATSTRAIDLVARSIRVEGQINAADLGITVGASQWNYENRNSQVIDAGDKPLYALDSSRLGGMYANRIAIVATEAGVGVRMRGDIAASADDFSLDANGRVEIEGRLSAARDLRLRQWGNQGADAFQVSGTDAGLTAGKEMHVMAAGGLVLTDATVKAEGNMLITAQQLIDRAGSQANGARAATGELKLEVADAAAINNTSWSSQQSLDIKTGSLTIGADGATLAAGANAAAGNRALAIVASTGDIDLSGANVAGAQDVRITSQKGAVRVGKGGSQSLAAGQDLSVTAVTELDNRGTIGATRNVGISAGDAAKTLAVVNRGTIQSDGTSTLAGTAGGRNLTLDNQAGAGIATKGSLSVTGTQASNAGVIQSGDALALNVSGKLANTASGQVLGQGLGSVVNVDAASLDNAGVIQSKGAINARIAGALSQAATGAIQTLGTDQAGSGWALVIDTQSLDNMGTVSGGGALTAQAATTLDNAGTIQSKDAMALSATTRLNQTNTGKILSEAGASVKTATLGNAGTIQSKGALALSATNSVTQTSTGTILSTDGASVKTAVLENAGTVQSKGAMALSAATRLTQAATGKILSDDGVSIATTTLDNAGTVQSKGAMTVSATKSVTQTTTGTIVSADAASVSTDTLDNQGIIQAKGAMALSAASKLTQTDAGKILSEGGVSIVTSTLDNAGRIQAGKSLSIGTGTGRTQVDNRKDGVLIADSLDAWVTNFVNAGTAQANVGTRIDASKQINNQQGATLTAGLVGNGGSLLIAGDAIVNAGTVNTAGQLSMNATDVNNAGAVSVKGMMAVTARQNLVNSGNMLSEGQANMYATNATNAGYIAGATALALNVTEGITNTGTLHGGSNTIKSLTLVNQGDVKAVGTLDVLATDSLNNTGKVLSDGSIDLRTARLTNTASGKVVAGSSLTGNSVSGVMTLQNGGTMQAGTALSLGRATQRVALTNQANGKIQSSGTLSLYGTDVRNETGARIQWSDSGLIDAASLTNTSPTSVVIGSIDDSNGVRTSEIKLSGALSNAGAIHSGGDLKVTAVSVNNTNTAGVSALNDLTITASGSGESLRNAGAFYAGRDMKLTANAGGLINAGDEGTMDAERDIVLNARDVTNQGAVRATNITVNATNSFTNQPAGALPSVYVDYSQVVSSRLLSKTNISKYNCFLGSNCDYLDVADYEVKFNEKLDGPMPTFVAQMLANQNLTINYGNTGKNMAGLLSAKNIKIAGTGEFLNEDFYLDTITFVQRTAHFYSDDFWSSDDFENWYASNETQFNNKPWESGEDIHWGTGGRWTNYGSEGLVGTKPGPNGRPVWSAYLQERDRTMLDSGKTSAGIYAVDFDFQGGKLSVRASPNQPKRDADKDVSKQTTSASGATIGGVAVGGVGSLGGFVGLGGVAGVGAISGKSAVSAVATKAAAGLTLGGVTIKLPTNPNGYYVTSKTPGAKFLVETNPLFQTTSSFLSSDYLADKLGIDPEETLQRLGDANYEAYLVRQQLINKTGKNLLDQTKSETEQLQQLYSNAAASAKGLGLSYGQPLSEEQIAALDGDIVWMVETEVDGVKVLAPVVYLSQASKDAITGGGIVASNTTIKADSVENTGGTIGGTNTLNITAKNDITNTSGTITGGNVNLKSTEGSIVNQTYAKTTGDDVSASTSIGKTGSITATGSLGMDAKNDIKIIGADVTAKDATLAAGGDITVDTIVDKTTTSSTSRSSGFMSSSTSNTSTTTGTNIGSNLNIGNNLTLKSGGDTTIAGSDVKVGGNLTADTGGDFNVLARQDTVQTSTSTSTAGVGVGGGLYGSSTTTTDQFKGTNSGSTLTVGGNANVTSQGTMTMQGSDVNIGGNAAIDAKQGIAILDGLDEERNTSRTETTTFGKIGGNSAAEATASAASKAGSGSKAAAEASANASGSVKLAETTTTNTASGSKTSVASTFNVGGSLDMKTDGTLTVQGSDVKAGGDLSIDAKTVNVLAGRNETYSSADSKSDSIGFYGEAGAKAGANAGAMGTNASASASAEAESTLTVGARTENASFSEGSTTNRGSTLSGGKNVTIKAKDDATFVGATVTAGNDLSVQATNIKSMAAQDTTYSTESAGTKTAGLYISAGAEANANANTGGAAANAGAEASAGVRYSQSNEGASSGSITQQTSSFTAGGNVNRNATGTITDQGTQITAGGNINQSANEIREVAAQNSNWESSSASSLDARIGVYAGAEAGADSRTGKSGADASIGVKGSVEGGTESSSSSSSTAVTSNYKAGGNINSTSTNGTTLIGTQFQSGGDVNINAGSLDYQAARNTTSSSSSALSGSAEVKVGIIGSAGVNGSAEIEGSTASSSSSTARAGGINAGGAINVNTGGNATFEGTNLNAGKGVNVGAGGDVNFNAATSTSENSSFAAGLSVSGGSSGSGAGKESEGAVGASLEASKGASSTGVGSNISAGSGGVNISGGKNVNLEGTQVQTTGATAVSAGGTVNMTDAKSSEYQVGVGVTVGAGSSSGGEGGSKGSGGFGIGVEAGGSSSSQGVNIQSGGGTRVINNAPASSVVAPRAPAAVAPAIMAPASSTGASIQVAPTPASGGRQVSQSMSLRSSGVDAAPSAGIAVAPAVMAPAASAGRVAPSAGIAIAPAVAAPAASTGTAIQLAPAPASGGRQVSRSMSLGASGVDAAPSAGIAIAPAVAAPAASTGTAIQLAPTPASGGRQISQSMSLGASGVEAAPSAGIAVAPAPSSGGRQIAPSVNSGRANLAVPAN